MPRMSAAVYAAHVDNLLKFARKKGEVTRPEIADELNVSRAVASTLIEKAGLKMVGNKGRTEYFALGDDAPDPASEPASEPVAAKQSKVPAPAQAVAEPVSDDTGLEPEDQDLADLDAQIVDTRNALHQAAAKAGKALGEWATHQAIVDSLRERMTELATKRMSASS